MNFRLSSESAAINEDIHTPVIKSRFRSVLDQLVNNSSASGAATGAVRANENCPNNQQDSIPRLFSTFSFQNSRPSNETTASSVSSNRLTFNLSEGGMQPEYSSDAEADSSSILRTGKLIDEIKSNKFSKIEMLFRSKINKLNNKSRTPNLRSEPRISEQSSQINSSYRAFTPIRNSSNRFSNPNLIQLTGDFTEVEDDGHIDDDVEGHLNGNVGDEIDDNEDLKQDIIDAYGEEEEEMNQLMQQPDLVPIGGEENEKAIFNLSPTQSFVTSSSHSNLRKKEDQRFQNKIDELNQTLEEQATIGRQVSSTLSEFYRNTWNSANLKMIEKNLLKYQPNIVEANKCLLVVAERQLLIQNEISMLQAKRIQHNHNYSSLKSSSVESCGKASLSIGNIRLKLHNNFVFLSQNKRNAIPSALSVAGNFVLCLVEHNSTLIESAILDIGQCSKFRNVSDHSIASFLQFDVNMRFDDLNPNFEVLVKFFSMNQLAPLNASISSNYSSLLKRTRYEVSALKFINSSLYRPLKKILGKKSSSSSEQQQLLAAEYHPITANHSARINLQPEEPIATSFKLLGQFAINRFNCSFSKIPIMRFDYSTPFVDKAYIDSELVSSHSPVKIEHSFWVQIENGIHPNAISLVNFNRNSFLHSNKSQFRASLSIDKRNFLICKTVHSSSSSNSSALKNLKQQFNLVSCINPCIEESILDDILLQTSAPTICLVFRQDDSNKNNETANLGSLPHKKSKLYVKFADGTKGGSGSRDSQDQIDSKQFKFLFISSNKVEELASLYRQISDRIRSVRIWNLSGNNSSNVGQFMSEQPNGHNQQLYWSLVNKFRFAN